MASISISAAWEEANALARREAGLLAPVALALIVLPTVLMDQLRPVATAGAAATGVDPGVLANPVSLLATLFASLVISLLALGRGISVGEAFRAAARRLAVAVGASVLLGLGFAMLALPAMPLLVGGEAAVQKLNPALALLLLLYCIAVMIALLFMLVRLLLLNTVAAAEPLGVIATVRRSWALTQGMFWRLLGVIAAFFAASVVASVAVVAAGGTVLLGLGRLLGDPDLGRLLLSILAATVNAGFVTWLYLMLACVYRQLVAGPARTGSNRGI
ncbi:hypothetical protein [Sphingomonas solaris]|uniref:Glycerophosphoryl diester phosphodiesterase membrane domain-containing protein n=1 Tax=Alterirhizorhabdus solaris TaxID=2529389 RepID=A0A558R6N6_9SPHN|nr:hypothetical protein [Sphingomonas solaris]TVV75041.1 hypothetical protein FOY91_08140 [Sphingomonas solaris]